MDNTPNLPSQGQDIPITRAMQKAIEKYVIQVNTCPPLTILANECRKPDKSIDWDQLSGDIAFQVIQNESPKSGQYISESTSYILNLYRSIAKGTAPLSYILVFPQVSTNEEFDDIVRQIMNNLAERFLRSNVGSEHHEVIKGILEKGRINSGQNPEAFQQLLNIWNSNSVEFRFAVLQQIMDSFLGPVYFYGNKLEGKVLQELQSNRGDIRRQIFLSRMPFNALQIVNTAHGRIGELTDKLKTQQLRIINTQKALRYATEPKRTVFEDDMDKLKLKAKVK